MPESIVTRWSTAAQPGSGGITIELDPVSIIISAIALVVSIWAVVVTKRAPKLARINQHRDIVRDALVAAAQDLTLAKSRLRSGHEIGPVGVPLASALSTLETIGPRLPEHATYNTLRLQLFEVLVVWDGLHNAEKDVEEYTELLATQPLLPAFSELKSKAERRRADARPDLSKIIDGIVPTLGAKIKQLDVEDRG